MIQWSMYLRRSSSTPWFGAVLWFALITCLCGPAHSSDPGPRYLPQHDDLGWHGKPLGEVLYRCAGIARAVAISVRRTGDVSWATELHAFEREALARARMLRRVNGACVPADIQASWLRALQLEGMAIIRMLAEGMPRTVAVPDIKLNVCRLIMDTELSGQSRLGTLEDC